LHLVLVLGRLPRLKGNSVKIRGCPAAVSENEPHDEHWPPGWEAVGPRNPGVTGTRSRSPKTCQHPTPGEIRRRFDPKASREAVVRLALIDSHI